MTLELKVFLKSLRSLGELNNIMDNSEKRVFNKGDRVKWNNGMDEGTVYDGCVVTMLSKKTNQSEETILVHPDGQWLRYVKVSEILD